MMIILNGVLLHLSGGAAVAAFSIVLYVDSIVASLLYGMTDSMQPAISYCYGAELRRRMFAFEKRVLFAGALVSLLTFIGMRTGHHLSLHTGERVRSVGNESAGDAAVLLYLPEWLDRCWAKRLFHCRK